MKPGAGGGLQSAQPETQSYKGPRDLSALLNFVRLQLDAETR